MTMRSLKLEELCLIAGAAVTPESSKRGGNNGLGNGDQTAPGGSLDNNKAENFVAGSSTGNPPGSGKWDVVPN